MGDQDKEKKRKRVNSSDAKTETNEEEFDSQDGALISLTVTEYQVLISKSTNTFFPDILNVFWNLLIK